MQRIAVAIGSYEVSGMLGIRFDLVAQSRDRSIDGPHGARRNRTPHLLNQLVAVDGPLRPLGEKLQDFEFPIGERNSSRRTDRAASNEVDRDPTEADDIDYPAGSPEHGADPGKQLRHVERLGDVIVGPQLESTKFVHSQPARRQKDDGNLSGLPNQGDELESAALGQHHIEQDQVRHERFRRAKRLISVRRALHAEPFDDQFVPEYFGQRTVIIDDQDSL